MGRIRSIERRLSFLLAIIIISLAGVSGRLIFVQAISAEKYDRLAEKQRLRIIELPPKRGAILDRNGNELAVSVMMDTVYATPYLIKNPEGVAKKLAPILKMDEWKILNNLTKQAGFTYLVRKTDSETIRQIKKLIKDEGIKGIDFIKESKRYYPNSSIGSHVLGLLDMDNRGLGGLELYYNDLLYGKPGKIIAERDAHGRPIPRSIQSSYRPVDGANICISIDREIQYKAEVELKTAVNKYKARSGSVIVMNPRNGEIYAMANVPYYNPNKRGTINNNNLRNRAITDLYEPGSTMKAVIACAALEEGLCTPSKSFYLEPTVKIGNKRIKDAHARPAKNFTFSEIVQESSNVGMVKVGLLLGKGIIIKYLERFGFTEKSGVDFPGEALGRYPKAENWSQMSLANIPFGQGINTTQLVMTNAIATIANDGVPVKPHFLIKTTGKRGRVVKSATILHEKRVVSAQTCAEMKHILEKAVLEGTGEQAKVLGYRVGGKTGTAQKVKVNERGYEKDKYIASFIGIAPIQDPQLVISVVIDEPQESIYGGSVAAPVFSKIAEFSLRYLKIPPE
ncbi:MAG: penicillin-binding protein 2 [Actinobacteria bacterium]|nr:penicillin-binding protein 2 [Actinomycetota bacterium]